MTREALEHYTVIVSSLNPLEGESLSNEVYHERPSTESIPLEIQTNDSFVNNNLLKMDDS